MDLFDLEKNFAFYAAYHSNPVNIFIHMLFVWPIFYTGLMLLYFVPMLFFPNFALFFSIIYAVFYMVMEKKAGFLAAILCFLCWVGASACATQLGYSLTWKEFFEVCQESKRPMLPYKFPCTLLVSQVVLVAQLICWTAQFLGHGVFEKRAPALLDNLVQAFLMAPFFVLLEALHHFFGYEPYPGFFDKVKVMVDADIKEWQEKKHKKSS